MKIELFPKGSSGSEGESVPGYVVRDFYKCQLLHTLTPSNLLLIGNHQVHLMFKFAKELSVFQLQVEITIHKCFITNLTSIKIS